MQTLDAYIEENTSIQLPRKKKDGSVKEHACFVSGEEISPEKLSVGIDNEIMKPLKQSLADAIVLSAVVGDHDVNPGNMLVVEDDKGNKAVARIDYGHALNDLLNAPRAFGGKVNDKDNPILDFFNREKVAGLHAGGGSSKLWRDYPSMVPSQEIVTSLRDMATKFNGTNVKEGAAKAKAEFTSLIGTMRENGDEEGLLHVKKSLCAIHENITGEKLDPKQDSTEILEETFDAVAEFAATNCKNLQQTANIMELQLAVDNALKDGTELDPKVFKLLKEDNFPRKDGKIQWVKTATTPAFQGTFAEYVMHKAKQLSKESPNKQVIVDNYNKLRTQIREVSRQQTKTVDTPQQAKPSAAVSPPLTRTGSRLSLPNIGNAVRQAWTKLEQRWGRSASESRESAKSESAWEPTSRNRAEAMDDTGIETGRNRAAALSENSLMHIKLMSQSDLFKSVSRIEQNTNIVDEEEDKEEIAEKGAAKLSLEVEVVDERQIVIEEVAFIEEVVTEGEVVEEVEIAQQNEDLSEDEEGEHINLVH